MAEPYISFEELDEYVTGDPVNGATWAGKTVEERNRYWNWIHNQINQHGWKGNPIASFVQRQAFPRIIEIDCIPKRVSFDSDIDAENCDIIIPRQLIAEAIAKQVTTADLNELIQLRDIGVQFVKTGPLETEFQEGWHPDNPLPKSTPLPEPLWANLQGFSLLTPEHKSRKTTRIGRG